MHQNMFYSLHIRFFVVPGASLRLTCCRLVSKQFSHFYHFDVFVSDQNAGTGQSAAGQYDVQLHQHLPDGGHQGAVESECSLFILYHVSQKQNTWCFWPFDHFLLARCSELPRLLSLPVSRSAIQTFLCLCAFRSSCSPSEFHATYQFPPLPPPPQGVIPTAQRAAIVVGVELPVYDITKKHLLRSGLMGDTILAHFM